MTDFAFESDLVVLTADKNMQFTVKGLLGRPKDIGIRPIRADFYIHPERDPGCRLRSDNFLRPFIKLAAFVIVIFDREGCGKHNKESLATFWSRAEEELEEGISGAIGCYIFSIRAGRGALPWYVGLAEKQSFRKESFTSHKLNHYNNAIADRNGTPLLTLIVKRTQSQKIVNPTGNAHRDIQLLETMLIFTCLRRNPNLFNVRDTTLFREMVVPGLLNTRQGKIPSSVSDFKLLIGA